MSSIAQTARAAGVRNRTAARSSRWALGGGVLWIALFTVLLAGVVAVNVTVLRLNLQLGQADRERTDLRADISRLRSELSSASATSRIDRLAQKELGLVPADPNQTIYVHLGR
jgi:cell division protein FtsL